MVPKVFSAPVFNNDFSDVYGAMTEVNFLCTYFHHRDLRKLLRRWTDWLDANPKRMQFTDAEKEVWASIVADAEKIRQANCAEEMPNILSRLMAFWDEYAKHL